MGGQRVLLSEGIGFGIRPDDVIITSFNAVLRHAECLVNNQMMGLDVAHICRVELYPVHHIFNAVNEEYLAGLADKLILVF